MSRLTSLRHLGAALFGVALLVLGSAPPAAAQTTTGTIRGYVRDSSGAPFGGAMVEARNVSSGALRTATSKEDGLYILPGLTPGVYDLTVRHIGSAPSTRRVSVQLGATISVDITPASQAVEVSGVTVQGVAPTFEMKTSEVATNVTPQQIQQLPTPSRNILDLAALAPGITVSPDRTDLGANGVSPRTVSGGASGPGEINLFIDGTSMKNDLTGGENGAGGIAGQDNSRGNPFPQSAIQEYRVVTQNFKAEYSESRGPIITATTKSGGNVWSGTASFGYQNKSLVALDTFQQASNFKKPDYSRYLFSLSAGGPLIADKLHVFGAYEGNYQNRANDVAITPPTGFGPAIDSINWASYNGSFASPFRESLLFGKLTYDGTPNSTWELSLSDRIEHDVRDFGGGSSFLGATNYVNNQGFGTLKYTRVMGAVLNEATASYSQDQRNPTPDNAGIIQRNFGFATLGSNLSSQNFLQKDFGLRDDITYTGFHGAGDHVFKGGIRADFLTYDINKANNETPLFLYGDSVNCNPACNGNEFYGYRNPYQLQFATGNPQFNTSNTQIGAYIQDDWSPNSRLTINLGVRWDFESHMFNDSYVTPTDVVDTITKYNNTLIHPIDPAQYFTDGTQRHPFYGAFQPRLGFSYDLDRDGKTTLFGGAGIFYDRSYFDLSVDETMKLTRPFYTVNFGNPDSTTTGQIPWNNNYLNATPQLLDSLAKSGNAAGREIWLISNTAKAPYSHQWNLGIRHLLGDVLVEGSYTGIRSYDQLIFNWANFGLNPNGTCCAGGNFGHGFTNVLYTTSNGRGWYDALTLRLRRPYLKKGAIGWGAGLSYTYATRSIQGTDNPDDEFAFPNTGAIPKHPSNDEKSHVVADWITDLPYLFGVQFSGLITLGSGPRFDIAGRFDPSQDVPGGFTPAKSSFIIPAKWWAYREVDVRLRKDFPNFNGTTLGVTLDVFNLFNYQNFGCFNTGPQPNPNFGVPGCVISDARRAQIGAEYNF